MAQRPIEALTFADLLHHYHELGGHLISVGEALFAVAFGASTELLVSRVDPRHYEAVTTHLGMALAALAGTFFGIAVASFAVTGGILSDSWGRRVQAAGGFPALLVPYWLTGIAWAIEMILAVVLVVSPTVVPRGVSLTLITAASVTLAIAISWSLSLFGSIMRLVGLRLDMQGPH